FSECNAVRKTSWRTNLPGRADQAAVNPVCSHALKVTLRMKYVLNSILSCSPLTTLSKDSVAEAVQNPTCGWDEPHSTDSRSTVWSQLSEVDRSHTYTYELELLRRWHQECDATAGRVATQRLRQAYSSNPSPDAALLLAVSLARGPELQIPRAEGIVVRALHGRTNAEPEAVRLLASAYSEMKSPLAARELALLAINSNRSETRTSALEALRYVSNLHNDVELAALVAEIYIRIGQPQAAWQTIEPFLDTQLPAVLRIAGIARLLLDTDPTRGSDMY